MTCKEKILSNAYVDLVTDYKVPSDYNYVFPIDYCYHEVAGELGVLYVERENSERIGLIRDNYLYLPKCYGLMQESPLQPGTGKNEIAFLESGITSVQNQPLNLTGKGVVIGFIDTGIRYGNDEFLDAFGKSRILAIWDQTIQTGTPPEGFEYGSEYTKEQIDRALESDAPFELVPSDDVIGHGTTIASVAAGSDSGAAPDCDIVVVKLKEAKEYYRNYYYVPDDTPCFQENDIMLAIQYLQRYVKILVRPLVICLGVGTNLGDHTGNGLLGRYISYLSNLRSRVFIIAAGNEGNQSHHYRGNLSMQNTRDEVEVRVGPNCDGYVMDFYGDIPYQYQLSVRSPAGEVVQVQRLSSENRGRTQRITYSFLFEGTKMEVDYFTVEPYSGSQFIRFRMEKPANGIWTYEVTTVTQPQNTSFDIWLPISDFLTSDVVFLRPNPDTTITSPGYVDNAITVSTYQVGTNSIWQDAGRGYSRNDQIKPDITAPGVEINTVLGNRTGSSMSAAITAGAAALLFQWLTVEENDRFADSNLIKSLFISGAKRDRNLDYPNPQWGYGRLDVAGVFSFLAGLVT